MACLTKRHLDSESEEFLNKCGFVLVESIDSEYSAWSHWGCRVFIPLTTKITNVPDLVKLIQNQSFSEGYRKGKSDMKYQFLSKAEEFFSKNFFPEEPSKLPQKETTYA